MKNWKLNLLGVLLIPVLILFMVIAFDGVLNVYYGFTDWWNKPPSQGGDKGFDTFIKGVTSIASAAVPILFFRIWSLEQRIKNMQNK